jgi:hypothetical protein
VVSRNVIYNYVDRTGTLVRQYFSLKGAHDTLIRDNELIGVSGVAAGILLAGQSNNNEVRHNNCERSGLPGWSSTPTTTAGPGCVQLDETTHDNRVNEDEIPDGTSLCQQVNNQTMIANPPLGSNDVVGFGRECLGVE